MILGHFGSSSWIKCSSRRCSRASIGFACLLHLSRTWSSNAAQRLYCRTRRMVAVLSPAKRWPPAKGKFQQSEQGMGRRDVSNRRRWRRQGQHVAQVSQPRSRRLPGGSPCRRFHEGHKIAGSNDRVGAERPCREVWSGSSGLNIGDRCVPKSCTKPNCVWRGSVQRPRKPLAAPPAPPDWEAEVMRFSQEVVELQCQRPLYSRVQASHAMQSSVEAAQLVEERASKRRARGEEVPSTEQALAEWLCTKHLELRDALEIGDPSVVGVESTGAAKMQTLSGAVSMVANPVSSEFCMEGPGGRKPHIQQGFGSTLARAKCQRSLLVLMRVRVSHARVFGRPALTSGSEVATERDPVDPTIRDGTVYRPTLADRSETQSVEPLRQRRRLVLLSQEPRRAPRARDVSGSDKESLHSDVRDGVSEGDGEGRTHRGDTSPTPVSLNLRRLDMSEGSLDEVDLEEIFERRAAVMRTVWKFLQGIFRSALRVAFEEEAAGSASGDEVRANQSFEVVRPYATHAPPQTSTRRFGPSEAVGGTLCSLRSGKLGRIVARQSRSRRASQCPNGAKTPEGIHG